MPEGCLNLYSISEKRESRHLVNEEFCIISKHFTIHKLL